MDISDYVYTSQVESCLMLMPYSTSSLIRLFIVLRKNRLAHLDVLVVRRLLADAGLDNLVPLVVLGLALYNPLAQSRYFFLKRVAGTRMGA